MSHTREHGPREKIICYLPGSSQPGSGIILQELRRGLCTQFGGFSESHYSGGWKDAKGDIIVESGIRFEVSYESAFPHNRDKACLLFCGAGEELGQTWVHLERSHFEAEHTRVS